MCHLCEHVPRLLNVEGVLSPLLLAAAPGDRRGFTCFDTCPARVHFFSTFIPGATRLMLWRVALAALALFLV